VLNDDIPEDFGLPQNEELSDQERDEVDELLQKEFNG
jgi:hypothetical protein